MKYAALNRRHRKKRRGCNANKPKSENAVMLLSMSLIIMMWILMLKVLFIQTL